MERQRAAEAAALGRAGQEAQKLVEQRWKREAETHQAEAPGEEKLELKVEKCGKFFLRWRVVTYTYIIYVTYYVTSRMANCIKPTGFLLVKVIRIFSSASHVQRCVMSYGEGSSGERDRSLRNFGGWIPGPKNPRSAEGHFETYTDGSLKYFVF